jgi:hypothetical protein
VLLRIPILHVLAPPNLISVTPCPWCLWSVEVVELDRSGLPVENTKGVNEGQAIVNDWDDWCARIDPRDLQGGSRVHDVVDSDRLHLTEYVLGPFSGLAVVPVASSYTLMLVIGKIEVYASFGNFLARQLFGESEGEVTNTTCMGDLIGASAELLVAYWKRRDKGGAHEEQNAEEVHDLMIRGFGVDELCCGGDVSWIVRLGDKMLRGVTHPFIGRSQRRCEWKVNWRSERHTFTKSESPSWIIRTTFQMRSFYDNQTGSCQGRVILYTRW